MNEIERTMERLNAVLREHIRQVVVPAVRVWADALTAIGRQMQDQALASAWAEQRGREHAAWATVQAEAFQKRLGQPPTTLTLPGLDELDTTVGAVRWQAGVALLRAGWMDWTPERRTQALHDLPPGHVLRWER